MGGPELPETPAPLKIIQPYLKIANEHDQRNVVISYWARLYALQSGLKLSTKTSEETNFLLKLMDWLEAVKKANHENEAITNDIAAQAHIENWALKLFLYADKNDRASNFGKNVIQSFYTAGLLYDVLATFGELSEEATQNRKYAKWKAAYIHNCLKNGETPMPGPAKEDDDNSNENIGNDLDENEDNLDDENNEEPGPSVQPTQPSQPMYPTMPTQPTPPTNMGAFGFPSVPAQSEDKEDDENNEEWANNEDKEGNENNDESAENEDKGNDEVNEESAAENEDKKDNKNNKESVENEDEVNDENNEESVAENDDKENNEENEKSEPHPYNPAPTPTNPGTNNKMAYEDRTSSLKTEGGIDLTVEMSGKAQKYIKWAGSALNYDDVPTAILNLKKALHLLVTGEDPV